MVPSAYLRVFQPLDAFERDEQLHWERYLLEAPALSRARPRYADRRTVGSLGLLAPADGRARRDPGGGRPDLREPEADASAGARRDAVVP